MVWLDMLMEFNATFNKFYWRRKLEYTEKTTDLPQVIDKLYHIMLYRVHLVWAGFELTTLVVIGIDCIGSCKFNYHTITTTTAPNIGYVFVVKMYCKKSVCQKYYFIMD